MQSTHDTKSNINYIENNQVENQTNPPDLNTELVETKLININLNENNLVEHKTNISVVKTDLLSNSLFKTPSKDEIKKEHTFSLKQEDYAELQALYADIFNAYSDYYHENHYYVLLSKEITPEIFNSNHEVKLSFPQFGKLLYILDRAQELGRISRTHFGGASWTNGEQRDPKSSKELRTRGAALFNKIFGEQAELVAELTKRRCLDLTAVNCLLKLNGVTAKTFLFLYQGLGALHLQGKSPIRERFLPFQYECLAHIAEFCNDFDVYNRLRIALYDSDISHYKIFTEANAKKLMQLTQFENLQQLTELSYGKTQAENQIIFDNAIDTGLAFQHALSVSSTNGASLGGPL